MTGIQPTARRHHPDGSSVNLELNTVTFALTLPLPFKQDGALQSNTRSILHCLARSIETSRNPAAQAAMKAMFDLIHARATPEEKEYFPNWFDSQ